MTQAAALDATSLLDPRTVDPRTQGRSLGAIARNENGAMMIMGVFMATLIVAMLYYVAGVGETIVYRERMQDAADSGALAGAVFLARGMNLIVLLNITLASVFGVLVAAWTAFFVLLTAAGYAWSNCSIYNIPACIAGICLTIATFRSCSKIEDAKDIVADVASATHGMQSNAKVVIPLAAAGAVIEGSIENYQPPVDFGIGVLHMGISGLPIEDDPSPPICDRTTFPNSFAWMSWIRTSMHGQELADDIGGSCNGNYLDSAKATAFLWSFVGCQIAKSEVKDELMRVTDGVEQGDEEFQFRTLMTGTPPYGTGDDNVHDERVAVATWHQRDEARTEFSSLQAISRFSFSQAEFYYDDQTDREDWMWEFKWRARLRRFRPQSAICGGTGSFLCGALGAGIIH